jgi:hypothetical protein
MLAGETGLLEILSWMSRQYVVPLFQRQYVWDEEQWSELWDDIVGLVPDTGALATRKHFVGSVVTQQGDAALKSVMPFMVIDGQQRLTTFMLLLKAMDDHARGVSVRELLENYLRNPDASDDEVYRVLPTEVDREAFRAVIAASSPAELEVQAPYARPKKRARDRRSALVRGYFFFHRKVGEMLAAHPPDVRGDRLKGFYRVLALSVRAVDIALQLGDNAQVIFETLNAKGVDLLASDLIRNLVFQRAASEPGVNVGALYRELWKPFDEEGSLWRELRATGRRSRTVFDLFLQHFLVMHAEEEVNVGELYARFKRWLDRDRAGVATERVLRELRDHAAVFATFYLAGADGRPPKGARELRLYRVRELDITTMYPFLLRLLTTARKRTELECEVDGMLEELETYVVRRAVCGLSSKNFNHLFARLYSGLEERGRLSRAGLRAELYEQTGTLAMPTDEEVRERWLNARAYQGGNTIARVHVILEAIELQLRTSNQEKFEFAEKLTVEHLLPQKWEDHYADVMTVEDEALVDSFGNLTLLTQGLNSAISNGPFHLDGGQRCKRSEILQHSLLNLNAFLATTTRWDVPSIHRRGEALLEHALRIWPCEKRNAQRAAVV